MRAAAACLVVCALPWLVPSAAAAHARPLSYAFVRWAGGHIDVRVQIAPADLAVIAGEAATVAAPPDSAGAALQRELTVSADGRACAPLGPAQRAEAGAGWIAYRWSARCASAAPARIDIAAKLGALSRAGHRQLVRFERDGRSVERVLELGADRWRIDTRAASAGSGLLDYVRLGVEHLLTGYDHIAFVIALILLAQRLRDVALLVTAFTLAHSLSLALAVVGVVVVQPAAVEALIGFSIALLGIENCWLLAGKGRSAPALTIAGLAALAALGGGTVGRPALAGITLFCICHFALLRRAREPAGLRVAVAFAFGLIHGFGFASAMAELQLGPTRLAPALFGFNLGVELGQLAVVLLIWPPLRALARVRDGGAARVLSETGSSAVAALGLFWFVTRMFGAAGP